jgi:hypothetical protein
MNEANMAHLKKEIEAGENQDSLRTLLEVTANIPERASDGPTRRSHVREPTRRSTISGVLPATKLTIPVGSREDTDLTANPTQSSRVKGKEKKKEIEPKQEKSRPKPKPKPKARTRRTDSMSSQRIRQPRSGARGGAHEAGEEAQMWRQILPQVLQIGNAEARAKELKDQIIELEIKMKEKLNAGGSKCLTSCHYLR